ncbi:Gram-negative bacterial tonB protein [Methyloligella halotolerans]|uniref:Gram-negative bacterial tonB protein n=1 Tax=Methyloligella halotolerans TaxID=1177755 RepID=A0A1E2RYY0_9HYPH|nr:energy transducer TonB [Methyloligella halotolerans]ODA67446.1 Gram-negative bacterial tonB protein [Methyloligella halotolerans]
MIRFLTWLISLSLHAGLAAFFLYQPGGKALQEGSGEDLLVVEQGVAIEGLSALGQDEISLEPVEAPPPQMAQPSPPVPETEPIETAELAEEAVVPPKQVEPLEDTEVIESEQGPEQELDIQPEVKPVEKPPEEVEEVDPEVQEVKKQPPPQIATIVEQTTVQKMQSSGQERKGGTTTSRTAYIGSLRTHLEKNKVNPRSRFSGTVLVRFTVNKKGELILHEIKKSSGSKVLDQAALDSIERSAPFPAIPEDWGNQQFTLVVPYNFSIRDRK